MVLLSVITPHYNMPDTLCRLRDSIPNDGWIEHIVVDDKSNCDGEKLNEAKSYVTARGSIWVDNQSDQKGAGVCRDLGIQRATGRWILVADSDDYFVDGAFEIIAKYMESEEDIVYFPPTSIKEPERTLSNRHIPYLKLVAGYSSGQSKRSEMRLRYLSVPDTSKLIRLNLIRDNHVKSSTSLVANDVMFSVQCAFYAKRIKASEEVIYCITESAGTLTTTKDVSRFRKRVDIYIEQNGFLREHLPAEDYSETCLSARGLIRQSLRDYGIGEMIRTVKCLRKNKAPINVFAKKIRV